MRRYIFDLPRVMMTIISLCFLGACNYGDNTLPERESKVTLYGTAQTPGVDASNSVRVGQFIINNFQVGTQEVDMSFASSTEFGIGSNINNANIRSNEDAELATAASHPQTNILISSGDHRTAVIGEGNTPNGNYTEITFKLYQNKSASSGSFARDKSLYLLGTFSGKPVRLWLTGEETIRAAADTPNGYEISTNSDLLLRFNLEKLLENIDLEDARDGNRDGFIDIGPNNVDGNADLHSSLRTNVTGAVEFSN